MFSILLQPKDDLYRYWLYFLKSGVMAIVELVSGECLRGVVVPRAKAAGFLRERGIKTSLGVSNISFGLPNRDFITSTFFAMALQSGLSAAIMNPYSFDMMT